MGEMERLAASVQHRQGPFPLRDFVTAHSFSPWHFVLTHCFIAAEPKPGIHWPRPAAFSASQGLSQFQTVRFCSVYMG